MPKYRAPGFRVEIITTTPTIHATVLPIICQQCSMCLPDDQEIAQVAIHVQSLQQFVRGPYRWKEVFERKGNDETKVKNSAPPSSSSDRPPADTIMRYWAISDISGVINDEQPNNACQGCTHTGNAIHVLQDTGSKQPGEDVGSNIASMPDGHSQRRLLLGVPRGSHQTDHRKKRTLSHSYHEATYQEGPSTSHRSHTGRYDRPCHDISWHLPSRQAFGEVHSGRKLGDDIANVEKRDSSRPHGVRHVQVVLHTCQPSIGHIDAIKVAHQQHERDNWQENPVQFALELFLDTLTIFKAFVGQEGKENEVLIVHRLPFDMGCRLLLHRTGMG
ncbi:hypothetical protein HG531_011165 [Fusarium graminearum]|nr:hypothetical protein HG531_011165 [Fusarium graminearum]